MPGPSASYYLRAYQQCCVSGSLYSLFMQSCQRYQLCMVNESPTACHHILFPVSLPAIPGFRQRRSLIHAILREVLAMPGNIQSPHVPPHPISSELTCNDVYPAAWVPDSCNLVRDLSDAKSFRILLPASLSAMLCIRQCVFLIHAILREILAMPGKRESHRVPFPASLPVMLCIRQRGFLIHAILREVLAMPGKRESHCIPFPVSLPVMLWIW